MRRKGFFFCGCNDRPCVMRLRTNLPTSNAGDAIGDSSVVIVNIPSNFRSGNGWTTSAEIRAKTLFSINQRNIGFLRYYLVPRLA